MKFHVTREPIAGAPAVGQTYNHGAHVCRNGHDECASSTGGKCVDDVRFLCSRCRLELVGSEIPLGTCGGSRESAEVRKKIVRELGR